MPDELKVVKHGVAVTLANSDIIDLMLAYRYGSFARKGHYEDVEYTSAQIAEQAKWVADYTKLRILGIEKKFLVEGGDGYNDPDYFQMPEGDRRYVLDETREEFYERVDRAYNIYEENGTWGDTKPSTPFMPPVVLFNEDWRPFLVANGEHDSITQAMYDRYTKVSGE